MQKINIEIPDNLTPIEEYNLIARKLSKNLLPTGLKLIGSKYELKHLETQVIIKRVATEEVLITSECSVCETIFELKHAYKMVTNYGMKKRTNHYCSDECREVVFNLCGDGRAKKIRKGTLKTK